MTDQTPWCCTGRVSECALCPQYGTSLLDPCPGHPVNDNTQTVVDTARLHAERRHPDYEYATTTGPRKQWDDADQPPYGDDGEPDTTWHPNLDAGYPGAGWERFDHTEEAYWRRPKTAVAVAVTEATQPAKSRLRDQIAAAIYEKCNPGYRWADAHPDDVLAYGADADAALTVVLPHGKFLGDQLRNAEERLAETRTALYEVLGHFVHKGHPGEPCLSSGWISERTVARWRAVLYPPTPAPDSGPTVAEAAQADRNWDVQKGGE